MDKNQRIHVQILTVDHDSTSKRVITAFEQHENMGTGLETIKRASHVRPFRDL